MYDFVLRIGKNRILIQQWASLSGLMEAYMSINSSSDKNRPMSKEIEEFYVRKESVHDELLAAKRAFPKR